MAKRPKGSKSSKIWTATLAKDYLTGQPMDHKALECDTEKFFRVYLNPLGTSFSKPAYCLLDRLDYREDGNLYIIDYKTSATAENPTETSLGVNEYLPQLIFYKWAVEQKLDWEVEAAMICAPTSDEEHKYSKVDVNSLNVFFLSKFKWHRVNMLYSS